MVARERNSMMTIDKRYSRHPFEIFGLGLCMFTGIPLILGAPTARSLDALLPGWAENTWGALLFLGAGIALIGIMLRRRDIGLLLEQVGLTWVAATTIFYAAVLGVYVGIPAMTSLVFVLGFGASCGWRAVQIQKQVNDVVSQARGVKEGG